MGSPRINYKDHERDIGKEFDETYRAKLKYAEPMYAMEKKYGVKYAQNTADIMQKIAPQLVNMFANQIQPKMVEMDRAATRAQREGDVADIERLGGRVREAVESADPGTYALRDALNQRALEELELGGQLTGAQQRNVRENVRGAAALRGFGFGINDAMVEQLAETNAMEDRRGERFARAQSQQNASAALGADPVLAILGKQSKNFNPMAIGQQAAGTAPGQLFNLESGYAQNLYGQNANMSFNASKFNQQSKDALTGAIIGGVGSIAGGWLGGRG